MSFKAYYDVQTDTIKGCEPYSYSWFHERRHQTQFKAVPFIKSFNLWSEVLTYGINAGLLGSILLGSLPFWFGVYAIGLVSLPYTFFNLFIEVDALIFGTINWAKYKYW